MLGIQDYLRSGHSLNDLYQRYDIEYDISPQLGICVLNYRLFSPREVPLVRECRGLFLALDTWNVVCKSFGGFYERNEKGLQAELPLFDWDSALAMEKFDGAMVCIFYYQNTWHIGSRRCADGKAGAGSRYMGGEAIWTWETLTKQTLNDMGTSWEDFTARLDPDIYYTFELCGPETRMGVVYDQRFLALIGAVKRDTLEELDIYKLEFPTWKPFCTLAQGWEDIDCLIAEHAAPYESEGWVLRDKNFRRIKAKNPAYTRMMEGVEAQSDHDALIRILDSSSGYDSIYVDPNPEPLSMHGTSLLSRVLKLAKHISDQYAVSQGVGPEAQAALASITALWPQAVHALKTGLSMSDFLEVADENELLRTWDRYQNPTFQKADSSDDFAVEIPLDDVLFDDELYSVTLSQSDAAKQGEASPHSEENHEEPLPLPDDAQ